MILAELGASVIKIERPGSGDETRQFEPTIGDQSAYFFACNRSKRSVTVNIAKPAGQEIIHRLARGSDVLIENFPVGTLTRYGLDQATIRGDNPRLAYVSCTGFGQTGPDASRGGFDLVLSDIKMPIKSGYEVFAAAKAANPDTPVILTTGFGYDPNHCIVRARREGLSAVLFKPFKVDQLLLEIRSALKGAQA
jgi:CheY-like chemotaxis protein